MFTNESTLHNAGQFYNFANLIGLRNVQCIQNPKEVLDCVTAQMPNGNYVRYSIIKDLKVVQNLKDNDFYNSSMFPGAVGAGFLKHHFNIEDEAIDVRLVVCGRSGAGVVFKIKDNSSIYLLEVITTSLRPKGL